MDPFSLEAREHAARYVRNEANLPMDAEVVLTVADVTERKGYSLIVELAARVVRTRPHTHFLWLGKTDNTPFVAHLQKEIQRRGLEDRIHMLGFRDDVQRFLRGGDILLHAARAEPFGRVLMEAMHAELSVVAFAVDGVPEVVLDGETGLLVPFGNVTDLGNQVMALLDDPSRREQLAREGRNRVLAHFQARQTAADIETIIQELL